MIPIRFSGRENPLFSHAVEEALPDMISFLEVPGEARSDREKVELTPESLRARIGELGPALTPGTPAHEAALVLLAGAAVGHNVDRLSRFTGVRRDVVARCARRLVDNGVWHEGNTVSLWLDAPADTASFWADAAVAEGRLCRRIGDNGAMEWAPQGYWRKHYEYVGPRGAELPQTICYHAHVEVGSQDLPYLDEVEDDEETVEETPVARERRCTVPEAAAAGPVWLGGGAVAPKLGSAWSDDQEPSAELFPDAVWLG